MIELGQDLVVRCGHLDPAQPWIDGLESPVKELGRAGSGSWDALRDHVAFGAAASLDGGVSGLTPERWLRLVEEVWAVNEHLAVQGSPHARAARPHLARTRWSSHIRTIESADVGPEVGARLFGSRGGAKAGAPTRGEQHAHYLRVADARAVWFEHVVGASTEGAAFAVSDEDAQALVLRDGTARTLTALLPPALDGQTPHIQAELAAVRSMARRLFLPRYQMDVVYRVCGGSGRWAAKSLVGTVIAVVAAAVWASRWWNADQGCWTNWLPVIVVAAIGLATMLRTATAGPLAVHRFDAWCLKLPAVTVVGAAAAVSIGPEWMTSTPRWAQIAAAVACIAAVLLYLLLEAGAHNPDRPVAEVVGRAAAVWWLSLGHAAVVTAAVAGTMANVFWSDPSCKAGTAGCGLPAEGIAHRGPSFLLLAAASLALGVFLQSLWESEPITYPIAHLPRRGDIT